MTIGAAIELVVSRRNLSESDAESVMNSVMEGQASQAQISALLVALRMKGETVAELTGFARAMRSHVKVLEINGIDLLDTCGTGGDSIKTFNLSTAAAFAAAAAGARVAKHGNRAVTSKCGSADILEALGAKLDMEPAHAAAVLQETGFTFLFAPHYHPAMKHAAPVRRELKLRTVFNLLGPLTNPARANRQLIGVYSPSLVLQIGRVLKRLGCRRAVVAHGMIGIDEVSPVGATKLAILDGVELKECTLNETEFGIEPPSLRDITCTNDFETSIKMFKAAISEAESPEARAVLPSAGVALWVAGIASDIREGVQLARNAIASGKANDALNKFIEATNERA